MAIRLDEIPETTAPVRLDSIPAVQPVRLDKIEFQSAKGEIGFVEAFGKNPEKFIPIFGSLLQASEMAGIVAAAKRLENEDYKEVPFWSAAPSSEQYSKIRQFGGWVPAGIPGAPKWTPKLQRDYDLKLVSDWWNTLQDEKKRGTSLGGTVGMIVSEMPAFMAEFAISGGLAKAGEKVGKEALEKFLKKRLSKKVLVPLLGKVVGAGARTPAMMYRVAEAYTERRLPKNIELQDGNLNFTWPKEKPFTSFLKAYGDVFTEAFSEELGEFIKLPFGKKLADKMWKVMKIKHPKLKYANYIKRISTRVGFHGVVSEMGEEFAGDALRAVANIQDFGTGDNSDIFQRLSAAMQQDFKNLPAMAIGFSVPGAARMGASVAAFGFENIAGEPFNIDEIVSRAKAQETIDAKMSAAKYSYINTKFRAGPTVERAKQREVIEIEQGLEPGPLFEVPPEAPEEVPVIEGQISNNIIQQTMAFIDEGMPADKAFQWAKKMYPEKPKVVPEVAPVSPVKQKAVPQTRKQVEQIKQTKISNADLINQAKRLSKETGMSPADAIDFINRLRGEAVSTIPPGDVIKTQLGKRNSAIIRIAAGSKEVFDETMAYVESTGGLVENPKLLNTQLNAVRLMAAERRKQKKRQDKANMEDKHVNILSAYQPVRYALAKLELAAGFPLRAIYRGMNIKHNQTRTKIEKLIRKVYQVVGETPESMNITAEQNNDIKEWLFSKNKEAYNRLPSKHKILANQLDTLLQTEGAHRVKSIRWKLWKKYGLVPTGIPEGQNSDNILQQGLEAERAGTLDRWLDRQKWGARETYYMSEGFEEPVDLLISMLQPGTLRDNASNALSTIPGEAKTRKATSTYKKGLVLNNIHTHLTRLALTDELMDDLDVFWSGFNNAKPSHNDVSNMKKYIAHLLGKQLESGVTSNIYRKTRGAFWNLYFIDPFKSAFFFFRNSLQNIAYLPNQLSLNEVRKSATNLVRQWKNKTQDQNRVDDFSTYWENDINQKKKLYHEAILAREEITAFERQNKKLVDKARHFADMTASWALTSDSINRISAWNMFYDSGARNFNEFLEGKLTARKLRNRLKLDTLNVSQVNEILQELDAGNARNATNLYASYKTENTHFRYETTLRSAAEQRPGDRALLGLLVYPRGVFNLAYQNGYLPLVQGLKTGDYDKAYQALGAILSLLIFTSFAREILKRITGRDSYGLPSYTPIDPGISMLQDMLDGVRQTQSKGPVAVTKLLAKNLEFALPLADEMTNIYESQNDKAGVRFWQLVLGGLNVEYKRKYKKRWKKTNRSDWEKIAHVLFSGGFEEKK